MASPSVTYTFTNGTTADASQVNQNFTDLINAMTDGSKSFSIDALTVAGAATFNGAVTLGNATGDDITVTGYVASNVVPKTNNAYDFGSSANKWKDSYFAGNVTAAGLILGNETLSSYDEGTFVPTLRGSSGTISSITTVATAGKYTKIGNVVFFSLAISWSAASIGSATGDLRVGDLPFTSTGPSNAYLLTSKLNFDTGNGTNITGVINNSTNFILLYIWGDNTTGATVPVSAIINDSFNKEIDISGFYFA